MQEDNSEKRMFYKFIFLLAVALLIGFVYLWKWTADDPNEQGIAKTFKQEEREKDNSKLNGLDNEKIDEILIENDDNGEMKDTESLQKQDIEDASLEQNYLKSYGKHEIEQAKEQAETVLALYLLQITDWNKWYDNVTADYLKIVQKEIGHSTQENVKRELDKIELFASQPRNNNTITYGAFASWHVTVKSKPTAKPIQLYYITLEKKEGKWIVSDMVTPDNQNMEGEREEEK